MIKTKNITFKDHPEFKPNLTPREMMKAGIFGGTYWRPIFSNITNKNYVDSWKEFPTTWFKDIDIDNFISSPVCNKSINYYKVISGTSLRFWEEKNWIREQDPYGWFQWYCRFYNGRRSEDDKRQIQRFNNFAGSNGRFRKMLINLIKKKKTSFDDYSVSPVIRQGLLQWGYYLTRDDFEK